MPRPEDVDKLIEAGEMEAPFHHGWIDRRQPHPVPVVALLAGGTP